MSGIFRHSVPSASNNNNANETTPNKRMSLGAFCTSPGTLQDVTMDNSYGVGYRSPCVSMQQYHGASSPAVQGRSVREFEEHTAALRKENFNLKLRLYFIEENIPALKSNGADGCDTAMRELIDHKVEVEMLRRELEDKKTVLKDALQAIEDLENIQKETENSYEAKMDDLRQKIQFLELDRNADKTENNEFMNNLLGRTDILTEHVNTLQKIRELECKVKTSEDNVSELENKITFLDGILAKRDEHIKECEEKIKLLEYRNDELQEELEDKNKKFAASEKSKKEFQMAFNGGVPNEYSDPKHSTSEKNLKDYLEKCLKEARNQHESINNLQDLSDKLRHHRIELADKICIIDDLEKNATKMHKKMEEASRTIQSLTQTVKLQQTKMNKLKSDDDEAQQASSSDPILLPSAVNKKHTTTSGNSDFKTDRCCMNRSLSDTEAVKVPVENYQRDLELTIKQQESTIKSLRTEVKKKTADLQNLVNKELWEKNREIERLTKLINKSNPNSITPPNPNKTSEELENSFTETDYAKALERNKLLQLKVDILVERLNVERENDSQLSKLRNEVREARADADRSEQFRVECANLCTILRERLEELAGFLNSLLKHKDVLGFLAADRRRAMRKAVDSSLDLSKSVNRTLSISAVSMTEYSLAQLCNLSEILGNVNTSMELAADTTTASGLNVTGQNQEELCAIETLKAENKALKKELDKRRTVEAKKDRRSMPAAVIASLENQSESEAWSEPDRKVSLARIGLEDHSAKDSSATIACGGHTDTDTESETCAADTLNHSRNGKLRVQQQEAITQLEQLVSQRDERILQIQCQLVEADNRLKKENLRVLDLTHEVQGLRERNEMLHADLVAIGSATQQNNSTMTRDESMWLRQIEEQSQLLEVIQNERDELSIKARIAEQRIEELEAKMKIMRADHEVALMTANEHEQLKLKSQRQEIESLMKQQLEEQKQLQTETLQQLNELQRQYVDAQRNIDSHIENAKELRQTLVESELNARALKKQLDESTLQASKAIMERTKAMNDKLQVEQLLEGITLELNSMQTERETLQKRLEAMELAAAAEAAKKTAEIATQLNGSDISQSGYTSEEVAPLLRTAVGGKADNNNIHRMNNSSPDLGIESDAGRVSSVELTNVHRSLLMKIEMPTADSTNANSSIDGDKMVLLETDILDTENRPPNATTNNNNTSPTTTVGGSVGGVHDCAKVDQENAELRRKLTRTKRALEDTYQKLRNSNQMKAQIERDIKNQIIKTHNVLKNVRSNMEVEK